MYSIIPICYEFFNINKIHILIILNNILQGFVPHRGLEFDLRVGAYSRGGAYMRGGAYCKK